MARTTHLLAILALVIAAPLAAQEGKPARTLKARCISFQIPKPLPPLFAHAVGADDKVAGTPVTLRSYLNHETETISLAGDGLVFTSDPARSSLDEPAKLFGRTKVPGGLSSAIVIFLPGDGKPGKPKCRVLLLDDSTRAFPRGSLKVINLSRLPLRLMLEDQRFDITSGKSKVIEDPPVGESNASAMRAFTYQNEQWQRVGSGVWPHPGTKRVLQIAFLNPLSGNLEVAGIRDIAVRD